MKVRKNTSATSGEVETPIKSPPQNLSIGVPAEEWLEIIHYLPVLRVAMWSACGLQGEFVVVAGQPAAYHEHRQQTPH